MLSQSLKFPLHDKCKCIAIVYIPSLTNRDHIFSGELGFMLSAAAQPAFCPAIHSVLVFSLRLITLCLQDNYYTLRNHILISVSSREEEVSKWKTTTNYYYFLIREAEEAPQNSSYSSLAITCHIASFSARKSGKVSYNKAERIVPDGLVMIRFLELVHGLHKQTWDFVTQEEAIAFGQSKNTICPIQIYKLKILNTLLNVTPTGSKKQEKLYRQ